MSSAFNVEKQLTFYGSYHANKVNVLIHIICVPLLMWTFQVLLSAAPTPAFFPSIHHVFSDYFSFDFNWVTVIFASYFTYYLTLEPVAALLYAPQMVISILTANAFFHRDSDALTHAGLLNAGAWIAQFIGHGVFERRAPALVDNILQAFVLAPFFVHLELLFSIGYRPTLHKRLQNDVGKEITRVKRAQGDKRRAAAAKAS